ncbi:MAG: dihydroneopterin aldolase [Prevotellaceae bacterium]|nr:dihydroneopterin aldolase [Prevotellaceae bacterium]
MAKIILEKMQFYAHHGHFDEEQTVGAHYELTLSFDLDISIPSQSDNLADTVNYQEVYMLIKEEMAIKSRLLEPVVQRILDKLLARFPQIRQANLRLSKLNPPLGGQLERVSIEQSVIR